MNKIFRTLIVSAAVLAVACAHASVSLYYALDTAPTVQLTTLPITSTTTSLSLYFTSTTAIDDAELFLGYDTTTTQGTSATPIDKKVSLTSPVAGPTVVFNSNGSGMSMRTAGAFGASGTRPYGLDIIDASGPSGVLTSAATASPVKLLSVTLNNLALTAGSSYSLSFPTTGITFTNAFVLSGVNQTITATPLTVIAPAPPATPEPSAFAAVGLGALALLRRRRRA